MPGNPQTPLEKKGYRWKRGRYSLKKRRDPQAFAAGQLALSILEEAQEEGLLDLFYLDESGFSLNSVIPYAWQSPQNPLLLPRQDHRRRLNSLGLWQPGQRFIGYVGACSINADFLESALDDFAQRLTKSTVVVLDNGSTHHCRQIHNAQQSWEQQGLFLLFLPPYSPELNKIEILWHMIKFYWLPLAAYASFEALTQAIEKLLSLIEIDYKITFV